MARLTCHKQQQPDFQGRDERLLRLPGPTICRCMCGEREVARAEIWKDEYVIFKKWRIRVTSGDQSKTIKGGSPQKVFAFVQKLADGIDCTALLRAAPPKQRRRVEKLY